MQVKFYTKNLNGKSEYNIKIGLTEMGCDHLDWIHSAQEKDQ